MEDVKVVSVACGWRHSIVADSEGVVYTFGWCKYGQLGHGDTWCASQWPCMHAHTCLLLPPPLRRQLTSKSVIGI